VRKWAKIKKENKALRSYLLTVYFVVVRRVGASIKGEESEGEERY